MNYGTYLDDLREQAQEAERYEERAARDAAYEAEKRGGMDDKTQSWIKAVSAAGKQNEKAPSYCQMGSCPLPGTQPIHEDPTPELKGSCAGRPTPRPPKSTKPWR